MKRKTFEALRVIAMAKSVFFFDELSLSHHTTISRHLPKLLVPSFEMNNILREAAT